MILWSVVTMHMLPPFSKHTTWMTKNELDWQQCEIIQSSNAFINKCAQEWLATWQGFSVKTEAVLESEKRSSSTQITLCVTISSLHATHYEKRKNATTQSSKADPGICSYHLCSVWVGKTSCTARFQPADGRQRIAVCLKSKLAKVSSSKC